MKPIKWKFKWKYKKDGSLDKRFSFGLRTVMQKIAAQKRRNKNKMQIQVKRMKPINFKIKKDGSLDKRYSFGGRTYKQIIGDQKRRKIS
tara:strand:+ start:42 stop:308 length:267 start_codon:yes stop_codon:yes gene_type:complete